MTSRVHYRGKDHPSHQAGVFREFYQGRRHSLAFRRQQLDRYEKDVASQKDAKQKNEKDSWRDKFKFSKSSSKMETPPSLPKQKELLEVTLYKCGSKFFQGKYSNHSTRKRSYEKEDSRTQSTQIVVLN